MFMRPVNEFLLSPAGFLIVIDLPIGLMDTEIEPMQRRNPEFDWYRWHQICFYDEEIWEKYYPEECRSK